MQDGFKVAPFKSQNMSLNSYVTRDGLEIGRAQGIQAEASGVEATADMNPILLKPSSGQKAQVVVMGKPIGHMGAMRYREEYVPKALGIVREALARLRSHYDILVIEGAGSPAEVNLRDRDIANMEVARLAEAPVILVGDVDRGGALASIVGTLELLQPWERQRVKGFVLNKFRGDLSLLEPGIRFLEHRTGVPCLGVVPYLPGHGIDAEDSVALVERSQVKAAGNELRVAVLQLPLISNFTDFDPLEREPGVLVRYVKDGEPIGACDVLIIPGTKATVSDLEYLRTYGYHRQILAIAKEGTVVLGVCGGYQMLGQWIYDEDGVESDQKAVAGLGLLDTVTHFAPEKVTVRVCGRVVTNRGIFSLEGCRVSGYEIHMGRTERGACDPFLRISQRAGRPVEDFDGAVNPGGNVAGTYVHGLFDDPSFRQGFVKAIRAQRGLEPPGSVKTGQDAGERFDALGAALRRHLDIEAIYNLLGLEPGR
jgi:adenosylcobyric acid synthase